METHTEAGAGRLPGAGDLVEFRLWAETDWRRGVVVSNAAGSASRNRAHRRCVVVEGVNEVIQESGDGSWGWRWPGAGAVRVQGEGLACAVCGAPEDSRGYDDGRGNYWCERCGDAHRLPAPRHVKRTPSQGEGLPDPVIGELPPGESAPWRRAIEVTGAALAEAPAAFAAAAGEVFVCGCGASVPEGVAVCDACAEANEAAGEMPGRVAAPRGEVPPAEPLTGPPCACGSIAFEVRSGMLPGRIACMACGAERWKAPPDRVVNEGGEGRVTWKLSARRGMFAGEVRVSGELAASFVAASSEEVTRKMLAYVDGVLDPRDTRVPYQSPAITSKLVEVQALMGLHRLSEAIEKRIEDQRHAQLRARSRIIDEALGWWEGYQRAWSEAPALKDADAATVQACRALCDRLVTALFAQIAGAL